MHYGVNSQIAFVGKFVLAINIFGCKLFIEKGKSDFILATQIFKFVKKNYFNIKKNSRSCKSLVFLAHVPIRPRLFASWKCRLNNVE